MTVCGSPEYYSPEILLELRYGRCLDFYSLGVLLFELMAGLPPFFDQN
jgi:serine/threonine protein kinase